MADDKKKIKLFPYLVAWIAYTGAFLTRLSNIGNLIRDSFSDIHIPQKNDFYQDSA